MKEKRKIVFPVDSSLLKFLITVFLISSVFLAKAQCNFKTIGHRGGSSYYFPENTLVALEQGFMEDIYAAEVDIQVTKDGVPILMHDYYIDRTTNGKGFVKDLNYSYIKTLDAGSWKDPSYAGVQVPTLKEALLLAKKYNKKLYLNMKVFEPALIAKTLKEAGVPEDVILLDPDDLEKVEVYHQILPNSKLIYFGSLPEPIDNKAFYDFLKSKGVIAVEIPADDIYNSRDGTMGKLRDILHDRNMELWGYTINHPSDLKFLKDFGVDGLETDRPTAARQVFCENLSGGFFPEKRITGQWDFNGTLAGTIGSQLVLMGDTSLENQKIKFGTTTSFGLPGINGPIANVARIPAFNASHSLRFFSNIFPENIAGGLSCDNTYSLIYDLLIPSGKNEYTSLLQTSNNNSDDGDFFINGAANKVGVSGNYSGGFRDSSWIRLALTFDLFREKLVIFIDGNFVNEINIKNGINGRFCLNNNWGIQSSNFFSDNDGETSVLFVSSIQLRNYAMTSEEIKALGNAKAAKIETTIQSGSACPVFAKDIKPATNGGLVTLSASAGDSLNYQWEINKGSGWEKIAGEYFLNSATSSLTISDRTKLNESYLFRVIASNDCQTVSKEFVFGNINSAETIQNRTTDLFRLYPNPSTGIVNLQVSGNSERCVLRIFTLSGIEVLKQTFHGNPIQLNLAAGTYLVQLAGNKSSEVKKLVVK